MCKLTAIIMVTAISSLHSMKANYIREEWFLALGEQTKKICTKARKHRESSNLETRERCDRLRTIFSDIVHRKWICYGGKSTLSNLVVKLGQEYKLPNALIEKEIDSVLRLRRRMLWGSFYSCITKLEQNKKALCYDSYAQKWDL